MAKRNFSFPCALDTSNIIWWLDERVTFSCAILFLLFKIPTELEKEEKTRPPGHFQNCVCPCLFSLRVSLLSRSQRQSSLFWLMKELSENPTDVNDRIPWHLLLVFFPPFLASFVGAIKWTGRTSRCDRNKPKQTKRNEKYPWRAN
jgi:hypothetical protein